MPNKNNESNKDLGKLLNLLQIACNEELFQSFQELAAHQGTVKSINKKPKLFVMFHVMKIKFFMHQYSESTEENFFFKNLNPALKSLKYLFPKYQPKNIQNHWLNQLEDDDKEMLNILQTTTFVSLFNEMTIQAILTSNATEEQKQDFFKKHRSLHSNYYELWYNNYSFKELTTKMRLFLKNIKSIYFFQTEQTVCDLQAKNEDQMCDVDVGLILQEIWMNKILHGTKRWEIRGRHCRNRKKIALIYKNHAYGTCEITDSFVTTKQMLEKNYKQHQVSDLNFIKYKTPHVWVLSNVQALAMPVKIQRKQGQVTWATLENKQDKADKDTTSLGADN